MPLTPPAARRWLGPDSRNRPWPGHGAMMIRRAEALGDLSAALGSWTRLGLAALAWALGAGGAVLVGRGVADGGAGSSSAVGIGLLLVATLLGGVLVATGSALARATAAWWTLATAVRADGGRVDTTTDPDTLRAHAEAVAVDRTSGAGELWRPPLLPRTVVVVLLTAATVVLAVRAVLGYGEASTPYAADDVRGEWFTQVLLALVCLLPALLTASGLRRVHRARLHRVAHDEPASTSSDVASLTPAVGSGSIVVGGRVPGQVTPPPAVPAWPGPPPAAPDVSPVPDAAAAPPPAPPVAPEAVSVPVVPPADPVPADETLPTVRLSDGRVLAPGRTLVGRAPQPRTEEEPAALLPVADDRVSKTHLTVTVEPGRVVVVDRGSTNGTVLHLPDGQSRPLTPGEPVELTAGDVVLIGATTLTVGDTDVEHTVLRASR